MASVTIQCGSSGQNQGTTATTVLGAPGANYKYVVTGFSVDYMNNGAYLYDAGTYTFTLKLTGGGVTITIGTYSRSANGARPTISWSGSVYFPANTAVTYETVRNGGSAGIRNAYKITVTYNQLTRPTVGAGAVITKAQMDALRTWHGSGTVVTQYGTVYASHGNTYKGGLTAGSSQVAASWYNSVT